MKIFTIGFTKKSAETFFDLLRSAGVRSLLDTRLNKSSQLAGFAKAQDLAFFTRRICEISYQSFDLLAPTKEILDEYKKLSFNWNDYSEKYLNLLEKRDVLAQLRPEDLDGACFLCSEAEPHHCHRRLAAEYFKHHWRNVDITHL